MSRRIASVIQCKTFCFPHSSQMQTYHEEYTQVPTDQVAEIQFSAR